MNKRRSGFTLIELLVVVAIIALLVSILLPSLSAARSSAKSVKCLTNIRSQGQITQLYLDANLDQFPVRQGTATGGTGVYNAFTPSRAILSFDKRPIDILTCPEDNEPIRDYQVGDGTPALPDTLGIGNQYNLNPGHVIRYSYGINNMTGIQPVTEAEKQLFNPNFGAYAQPARMMLYADCAWVNARAHNVAINDSPQLKGRVGNAAAPIRMDKLATIPVEYGTPQATLSRHRYGSNIVFMDQHGETVTQKDCFNKVLYSWTETGDPNQGITTPPNP